MKEQAPRQKLMDSIKLKAFGIARKTIRPDLYRLKQQVTTDLALVAEPLDGARQTPQPVMQILPAIASKLPTAICRPV